VGVTLHATQVPLVMPALSADRTVADHVILLVTDAVSSAAAPPPTIRILDIIRAEQQVIS